MVQSLQAWMAMAQVEPMSGRSRTSRSSYLTVEFAHNRLIDLFFVSVFDTAIFHHDIVGYVAYTRHWPSPLRMVQSLLASMALAPAEPCRDVHGHQEIHT